MRDADIIRASLRREAYDLKEELFRFVGKLDGIDNEAARTVNRARLALFETWTILCVPPDDEDDH
jgi:hypothetical protein